MTKLLTPSGISYYKIGSGPDVIVYFEGYSSSPNPLNSTFYKSFLPSISARVTCYLPINFPNAGWEKPWNGTFTGTDFLNFVADENPEKRIFVTGFSAGGDPGYIYKAKKVTAFASVAGSDLNNYNGMMEWRNKGIPVWAFIGTNDTSENSRANCEKTWVTWYYYGGNTSNVPTGKLKDGKPTYVTGGHSSVPTFAYNPANGLWEWFETIGNPTNPVLKDPVKVAYFETGEGKLIVETEGGRVLKFTPD
jgi:hypothetical protein